MCDVEIRCGADKFYSHRCILSAISPYFKLVFSTEYFQNIDDGYFVSDLSDFPSNCVHFLLDFVYQKPDIDTSSVSLLFLKILDYLQIKDRHDVVETVARQTVRVGNCFKILGVADMSLLKVDQGSLGFYHIQHQGHSFRGGFQWDISKFIDTLLTL